MGTIDEEWQSWARDYKAQAPSAPAWQPEWLLSRVLRDSRLQALSLLGELVTALLVIAAYAILIVRGTSTAVLVIAAVSNVLVVFGLGYFVYLRRGTWRLEAAEVRTALRLTQLRRKADLRWQQALLWATVGFGLVVAFWAPFQLASYRDTYLREPWRAIVGFGGAYLTFIVVIAWTRRRIARLRRELAAIDSAARELDAPAP